MDLNQAALLLGAGVGAGAVNAVAGGGSLITFPSLLAIGLPPVAANVSNSVAVCPGYLSSVVGSRAELRGQRDRLRRLVPTAVLAAIAGCVLLLATPARAFELVVPFLVLSAAAALAFQDRLRQLVGHPHQMPPHRRASTLQIMVFAGALYGGYFGAALGVMLVAGLALVIDEVLNRINALKNVLSAVVGLVTVVVYAAFGPVNWAAVAVVAPATIVGGYAGARLARRLPARVLRVLIVGFGTAVGMALLWRAWR
jgi:uncharacterized protein